MMSVPMGGGAISTLAATALQNPVAIAVDDSHLYLAQAGERFGVGNRGSIIALPLEGGTQITLASGLPSPTTLTVGAGNAYWIELPSAAGTAIAKVPLTGGAATTLIRGSQTNINSSSTGLAVGATSIFWTTQGGSSDQIHFNGTVMKLTPK